VPQRGVKAVFYHVRRAYDGIGKAGKWVPEEDAQLRRAVQIHGNNWTAISELVMRSPSDCSDRFRQQTQYKRTRRRGAWSFEEEVQLVRALEELNREGKSSQSTRGFWVSVSKAMGDTRTPKQCQSKWSDNLQGEITAGNPSQGKTRRWKDGDSYILICKIASLEVDDEIDIDWKLLSDPMWDMWSRHFLQQKWRVLKGASNANDIVHHRDVVHHLVRWISEKQQLESSTTSPTATMSIPSASLQPSTLSAA